MTEAVVYPHDVVRDTTDEWVYIENNWCWLLYVYGSQPVPLVPRGGLTTTSSSLLGAANFSVV